MSVCINLWLMKTTAALWRPAAHRSKHQVKEIIIATFLKEHTPVFQAMNCLETQSWALALPIRLASCAAIPMAVKDCRLEAQERRARKETLSLSLKTREDLKEKHEEMMSKSILQSRPFPIDAPPPSSDIVGLTHTTRRSKPRGIRFGDAIWGE